MEDANIKNKMGIVPISKLLLTMGIPMILSMMLQAFYNIVDSFFVGNMPGTGVIENAGSYGLNALAIAFPIQILMIAVGVGTGVGINALLSQTLGMGNRERASKIAGNAIFLGICTYIVFLLIGIFGVEAYIRTQSNDEIVISMGGTYLRICCIFSFGCVITMIYEKLLQATGRTVMSTIAQVVGALLNIVLDPLLIFGLLGFPALGIAGAAYATVIGQVVTLALDMFFHHKYNRDVDTSLKYIRPRKDIIKQIYAIGIPAIIMQALMSFMTYGANIILGRVSSPAVTGDMLVTAYGTYYKIQQFVFFAAYGMNNSIIPLVAYNYGMNSKARVKSGIKYGTLYTLIIMLLGMVLLQIFAVPLVGIFHMSAETERLCTLAIRIITVGYFFAGVNISFQGVFQALGCGMRSLFISLVRMIVVVLPVAYLLTLLPNASEVVWWAFPIAEACALLPDVIFMRQISREKIRPLAGAQGAEHASG
ncbi:MAG: MATE family efflux transporter [Oscillospiraceae bacterium]|nr:MATE family efflux transporter [Oscillospiraceae bacterium]